MSSGEKGIPSEYLNICNSHAPTFDCIGLNKCTSRRAPDIHLGRACGSTLVTTAFGGDAGVVHAVAVDCPCCCTDDDGAVPSYVNIDRPNLASRLRLKHWHPVAANALEHGDVFETLHTVAASPLAWEGLRWHCMNEVTLLSGCQHM